MVEAAKAHNPFAGDKSYCCTHMARLGICLEPEMCFLIHNIPGAPAVVVSSDGPPQMSTEAKAFNPFAANSGTSSSTFKEFVPS